MIGETGSKKNYRNAKNVYSAGGIASYQVASSSIHTANSVHQPFEATLVLGNHAQQRVIGKKTRQGVCDRLTGLSRTLSSIAYVSHHRR
jgi:hypothetical protein